MRVLVVKLGSIGDIAHALPVLAAIHERYPEAQVDWLVETRFRDLLTEHPLIDRLVEVDTLGWRRNMLRPATWSAIVHSIRALRSTHYDLVFDFQGLAKSSLLARVARTSRRIGFGKASREPLARLLLSEGIEPPEALEHVVSRNLFLLQAMDLVPGDVAFPLPVSPTTQTTMRAELESLGVSRYCLLNPGAGWETKRWAPEQFGSLAERLAGEKEAGRLSPGAKEAGRVSPGVKKEAGLTPLVLWGPGEKSLAEEVVRASNARARLAPATDLKSLLALLRGAEFVVGGDTGPIHLAAALGTPVVGIYGPSNPASHGPYGKSVRVVWKQVECSPCHKRTCPEFKLQCLTTMSVDDVETAVKGLLNDDRRLSSVSSAKPAPR